MNEKYNWNFKTSYELLPEVFYKKVSPKSIGTVLFDSFDIFILTINLWRNPWVYLVGE